MSIFHRPTPKQLERAQTRLHQACPVTHSRTPIQIHGDDPHDPKGEPPMPRIKHTNGKRQYRLKNH